MQERMIDTAQKIKQLRKQLGLKQATLAERVGVTQSTVARWEQGAEIRPENLIALAELAGQSVDQFLKEELAPKEQAANGPQAESDADRRLEAIKARLTDDQKAVVADWLDRMFPPKE